MVHNIYVCLEHKKTFHSLRVAGRHAVTHYRSAYQCLEENIFIDLGKCYDSTIPYRGCDKTRMIDSTKEELKRAKEIKKELRGAKMSVRPLARTLNVFR